MAIPPPPPVPFIFNLKHVPLCHQVDIEKSKCQVSFEDDSVYWVLFKHIRTGINESSESLLLLLGDAISITRH